jgi:hypothetical protein
LEKPTKQNFVRIQSTTSLAQKTQKKWIQNKPLLDLVGKQTLFLQNKASLDLAVK